MKVDYWGDIDNDIRIGIVVKDADGLETTSHVYARNNEVFVNSETAQEETLYTLELKRGPTTMTTMSIWSLFSNCDPDLSSYAGIEVSSPREEGTLSTDLLALIIAESTEDCPSLAT